MELNCRKPGLRQEVDNHVPDTPSLAGTGVLRDAQQRRGGREWSDLLYLAGTFITPRQSQTQTQMLCTDAATVKDGPLGNNRGIKGIKVSP